MPSAHGVVAKFHKHFKVSSGFPETRLLLGQSNAGRLGTGALGVSLVAASTSKQLRGSQKRREGSVASCSGTRIGSVVVPAERIRLTVSRSKRWSFYTFFGGNTY